MWVKLLLLVLFCLMILGAVHFAESSEPDNSDAQVDTSRSLRLLTWNIGYAELEDDTRAHDKDLPAVADLILREDPDAVALQELTGASELLTKELGVAVSQNAAAYLRIDADAELIPAVNALLVTNGINVYELTPINESLEEAFLRLTKL